jgi:hypothetical protein
MSVALLAAQAAGAQSGDLIDTERPSFSASPFVLSPGVWQIETGYQYTQDNEGADYRLQTLPQALLRYGLNDEIEIQLALPNLAWRKFAGNSDSGMTDAAVGVKIQLTEDTASTPVAFLAGMSLPIGDNQFSTDSYDPTIGAAWAHARFFGTGLITRSNGDYYFDNGIGVNFAVRDDTNAYVEWQATLPENGGSVHRLNGGLLWRRQNNMQWDLNVALGLNNRAPDFSLGGGFSYRF